jgi:hypothetical protein
LVPQLHRHATSLRRTEEELAGDENQQGELPPVVGRGHSYDPR